MNALVVENCMYFCAVKECIVIIPTYNEIENIEAIIRAVYSLEVYFHIENLGELGHKARGMEE